MMAGANWIEASSLHRCQRHSRESPLRTSNMLNLYSSGYWSGLDRRELLRVGGLAMGGVTLPHLLARTAKANENSDSKPTSTRAGFGRARRCIILYLSGGNPQHDMFDPKPETPSEIRGEFDTIATSVPSIRFG